MESSRNPIPTQLSPLSLVPELPRLSAGEASEHPWGLSWPPGGGGILHGNPEYSLEAPLLKLKLQYFGYLIQRADSLEKTLMLEKNRRQKKNGTAEDEIVG